MKHPLGRFLAAVMVITLLLGMLPVGSFAAEGEAPRYLSLADCPSFTLRGPEGVYPLEQYSNNGILLIFGRVTCGNTQALLQQLNGRVDTLAERGIQVFANLEYTFRPEDFSTLPSVYPNITYTYGDDLLWSRLLDLVDPHLEGFIFPLVFVIDRNGSIIYYSTGYVSDMEPLLAKVDAAATDQPLPEPQPADDSYYGSLYKYTGDKDALQAYIRQQLAQKNPYISAFDAAYTGNWEDWVGEELAYAMFDILEADAEAYGPYTIPDTWVYYSDARQVLITLDYPYVPTVPTDPVETEPAPDVTGGTCGENLTWTLDGEGTLTISGTGNMENYETEAETPWAERREEIKRIVLEAGVTQIGAYAFASCTNLTGVTISGSVRRIGSNAFLSCGLTEVTIPEGVTQIDDAAFENCGHLTDIILSASVTQIGPNAFYGCRSLTTVHYGGTEEEKADISIISENKPILEAQWHYRCDGVICESTEPEVTKPEVTEPKETEPEGTEPAETKPATPPVEEDKPMENPFVDVAEDAYYAAPVLWAAEKGITTGMSETSFAPEATCTRGQIVTFLWRSKGSPAPASAHNPFTDVPADAWYTDAVLWAVEQGITTGTSATTFSPDAGCTRGQVATFLWRAEGEPASGAENIFTDITPDAYYYDAVLWAVANEITNGMGDGTFAPDAICTRGQIATFLYRAMA